MDDNKSVYDIAQELEERMKLRQQMQALLSLAESIKTMSEASAKQASILEDDYKLAVKNSASADKNARIATIISVISVLIALGGLVVAVIALSLK